MRHGRLKPTPISSFDESMLAAGLIEALYITNGALRARVESFLRVIAENTGDAKIGHAARVVSAVPSPGRPPIDDEDVLEEIVQMIARGIAKPIAVATVQRRLDVDTAVTQRWRRKLRKKLARNGI